MKSLTVGDLLYHSVHGVCRINQVVKESKDVSYALVPKMPNKMKLRFVIGAKDLQLSGFHAPVSSKEANKILDYLKTSKTAGTPLDAEKKAERSFAEDNTTWALAEAILSCSQDEMQAKDQKKRQTLQRAATGLVKELAFALDISLKEAAALVQKNLKRSSKLNPLILAALETAAED